MGKKPSSVFSERIIHSVKLYDAGYASKLIFTGGYGQNKQFSESSVGRLYASKYGVPIEEILIEERSGTTRQNLSEAAIVMDHHKLRTAIIVSDPLHMKRAMTIAKNLGIDSVSSPTSTTRYRTLKTKLPFLLRELYFLHHHMVTGT